MNALKSESLLVEGVGKGHPRQIENQERVWYCKRNGEKLQLLRCVGSGSLGYKR